MKIFKWIVSNLLVLIIALFIYQNLQTFNSTIPFKLDLYIHETDPWEHHLYTVILIAAALGFFIGLLLLLRPYFRVRRLLLSERQEKQECLSKLQAQAATNRPAPEQPAMEHPVTESPPPQSAPVE